MAGMDPITSMGASKGMDMLKGLTEHGDKVAQFNEENGKNALENERTMTEAEMQMRDQKTKADIENLKTQFADSQRQKAVQRAEKFIST